MAATTMAKVDDRLVVRCQSCRLVQFATISEACRKCGLNYVDPETPDEAVASVQELVASLPIPVIPSPRARATKLVLIDNGKVTAREVRLLQYAADGIGNGAIAEIVGTSEQGIKNSMRFLYAKFGVHDRAHAVATAMRLGLIT